MDSTGPVDPEGFLHRVVNIDGKSYERLEPITDYRRDPGEARILYLCRPNPEDAKSNDLCVMKVKVQVPPRSASDDPTEPLPGPSATTAAEWLALQQFRDENVEGVPHIVASQCSPQGPEGPFPGGYISYTIMTRMPGQDLMACKFWSMEDAMKEEIRQAFVALLKSIWRLGIAPYDCALRNIIWDEQTRQCSIVDFEHYLPAKDPINMTERKEMERWGIVQRKPPSHWAVEWGLYKDPNVVEK
ncbi:hypothetical protein LTR56_008195 [Elasticomyces elasticus]|nr:hypothetical protein LTR56_008195 [Elasticomyces elasticus]KAK4924365.1 hypothetical protein LTR49_008454 [Elasticomyces elasticus]KAK5762671.1 hypothetical protein LTS12_007263 [Elasticomyces elasticus]